MPRRLSPDERKLWGRVAATAKPMSGRKAALPSTTPENDVPRRRPGSSPPIESGPRPPPGSIQFRSTNTLDGSWDKRIAKGALEPDFTIDLHGETAASAHARLNRSLAAAIRAEARVVLLITGKAARDNPRLPPTTRGVIRASVKDWLAASSHAGHIAAIRNAHPRHGGAGALYLVLRRAR